MPIKEVKRAYDPIDGTVTREVFIDKAITEAAENPWVGHLKKVDHDEGPSGISKQAGLNFELIPSTLMTIPGRVFGPGDAMSAEDATFLQVTDHCGKALSRSDTLEVVGNTGLREVIVPPRECLDFFFELSERLDFCVEGAGLTYGSSLMCVFARHRSDVTHLGANRFIRYLYFLTAFGSGCTPTLIHAAFHPISGKLLPVDAQKLGSRKTRAVQTAKRSVRGSGHTFSQFTSDKLGQDWSMFSGVLQQLADRQLAPLETKRVLTMSLGRNFSSLAVMSKLARNVQDNCRQFPKYRQRLESRWRQYQQSHVLSTPETMHSALGAFLFGCVVQYQTKSTQTSKSYATEIGPSGMNNKRAMLIAAREMLG